MVAFIRKIFRKRWETVYTTLDQGAYFKYVGMLSDNNIRYKTALDSSVMNPGRHSGRDQKTYTILVRVEDTYKISNIVHEISR